MALGTAMAGGGLAENRQANDFYATPPSVTRALLVAKSFGPVIHEPACGNGAMAMVMQLAGYSVISTDINPLGFGRRADFFDIKEPLAEDIVTNPPFKEAVRFIRHGLGTLKARRMALMLKSTFWHAKARAALFDEFRPAAIHPLLWRPDFLSQGRPTMEMMWVVWDRDHVGDPIYRPLPRPADPAEPELPVPAAA